MLAPPDGFSVDRHADGGAVVADDGLIRHRTDDLLQFIWPVVGGRWNRVSYLIIPLNHIDFRFLSTLHWSEVL